MSGLLDACKSGHLDQVKQSLDQGADINARDEKDKTCLILACLNGHLPVVKYLVEDRGADMEEKDENGDNCLMLACYNGHLPVVKYLVEENNVNIEEKGQNGLTCLIWACYSGHLPVIKYLVEERNANVDENTHNGDTCLIWASNNGLLPVVKYLVEEGNANIEETNHNGDTCLLLACINGHLPVVKYLVEERNADVEVTNHNGDTCLIWACHNDHLPVVKFLVEERGANIEEKDHNGLTCLMGTCQIGHLPVVKYLVEERGANIGEKCLNGFSCLMLACCDGRLPVVKYLVEEKNTNIEEKNDNGDTCLLLACYNGHLPVVKYLVEERNANIKEKNHNGDTCLFLACFTGHLPVVKYLVEERNANVEEKNPDGDTCLVWACNNDHLSVVKYLVVDNWMEPPNLIASDRVKEFLNECKSDYLNNQRRQRCFEMRQLFHRFDLSSHLLDSPDIGPFLQNLPFKTSVLYEVVERKSYSLANLKVHIPYTDDRGSKGSSTIVVYAKKDILSESCAFMKGLLSGNMNDVHDDPQEKDMQMVELSEELLQGCPSDWLKQLMISLSWSSSDEHIRHSVSTSFKNQQVSFEEIVKALKYCRTCDALGVDLSLSMWTDFIHECVSRFNNQWIEATLDARSQDEELKYCISNITLFNGRMLDLWTHVLGENDDIYFFIFVNAAPSSVHSPTTVANDSWKWLMSSNASGKYRETLNNVHVVTKVNHNT
eukprot:CAMPEP_0117442724 /NCGR_PEP_ID=MMETSP0759-20121206/4306_1 /TAXON_ID=63605 /ORGANISM="Percolomonas cosmopolitus, Strain WS" /LENGTH=717 /DNA_ID=CAMNT_0005234635 /DNA_START=185 /DNA_END=2338 /DNA_ORIENTATION=-